MNSSIKSGKNIELIDLTMDEDIKEEPAVIDNQCQSSTCQYTFRILVKNEISTTTTGTVLKPTLTPINHQQSSNLNIYDAEKKKLK
ncbi:unnamed protein product, partial [Rotaria sp. Silwood1]